MAWPVVPLVWAACGLEWLWRAALPLTVLPDLLLASALAALVVHGRRAAVPVLLGALVAALIGARGPWPAAALDTALACAEAAGVAALLHRMADWRLSGPRSIGWLAGAALLAALLRSALAGWLPGSADPDATDAAMAGLADLLGLLLFGPALLSWTGRPSSEWRPRRWMVGLLLPLMSLGASAWVSWHASERRHDDAAHFAAQIGSARAALDGRLQGVVDALSAVQAVLQVQPALDQARFARLTEHWAERHDLHALGVLQRLDEADLPAFEAGLALAGAPEPRVRSASGDGGVRAHRPGEPVWAIRLIAPPSRNAQVLGINSYANPVVAPAVDAARASGRMAVTSPFPLRTGTGQPPVQGVLMYAPMPGQSALAFATMRLDQLLPDRPASATDLSLCLRAAGARVLAASHPQACATVDTLAWTRQLPVGFGDQVWTLALGRPAVALSDLRLVAALSQGLLVLLGLLLLATTGHARLHQRLAARAQAARLLAEGARQAMQDFLRRARHELKAPLNAILGTAQLMHDPGPGRRDDIERWVDQLRHAGTHLSDMLDDLMVVSDSSVGHIEVRDAPLPLRPVVLAAVDVAGHGGSPMDWQIDAGDDALEVHGDARRIRQVLVNLLSNAVKYSPAGGQVRLRVVAEADTVRVQVEDDGLGLSAEQQAGLFQAFNRLGREHSAIEGSGIGLYLSQQLALRMGGRIEVDSIEGVGSRFTLCLRRASMGARVPAPRAQEPAGRLVILAVEDDPVACAILRQLALRHTYWHLVLRDRLAGALEQVRLTRPAVILLDSHLPDGDGRSLMSAMCADPALAGIPVVLISGDEGADPGMARACVPKPWNIDNLVQTIHHLANATGAASAANAADTNASAAVRLAS